MIYDKHTSEQINGIGEKQKISNCTQQEFYNAHTASGLKYLQLGGNGISPISGNFYPGIHSWLCKNANNPVKVKDAIWIQEETIKMERIISRNYLLSTKYFLQKNGAFLWN